MSDETAAAKRRRTLSVLCSGLLGAVLAVPSGEVAAQASYPDRPGKIVVGFAPGGTNDILARLVAAKLEEKLQTSFIVENKPGASSALGTDYVAKAKPDGYTLLVSSSGGLTVNPVLMKNLAYDPTTDFEPIALLGSFPLVVTVPPGLPVENLAGLIAYAKSKGGELNHGVAATSFQLVAETLASAAGIKFNQINYRGSGPVVVALMSEEVHVGILDSAAVMSNVKAGKLKALAVTTGKRSSAFLDIPTVAEAGLSGYDVPIWTALMAPKGTPEPVLAKLRTVVGEILADSDTVQKLRSLGMDPGNTDGPALAKRIAADIERWRGVAKTAGIKPQ